MSLKAAFAVPHPPIILAEIGRGEEHKIAATDEAYRAAMKLAASYEPETVVVTSPHSIMYQDYFHISPGADARGDFSRFRAPQVKIEQAYDEDFVEDLEKRCAKSGIPGGTLGEQDAALDHGTMIPLCYLNEFTTAYRLVRIGLAGLSPKDHYRFGQAIAATAAAVGRKTVLLASGDLSHKLKASGPYGFDPSGPVFDETVTKALGEGDFLTLLNLDPGLAESAAECGLRSFWIMAGALDRKAVKSALLSYEGTFGVGYGVASFEVIGADEGRNFGDQYGQGLAAKRAGEDPLVQLARLSLETYVKTGEYAMLPADLPTELTAKKAGAFVSLKKHGSLRGCIGTIAPFRSNLAEEILYNAVSAGVNDSRFAPVTAEELDELVYSVDVLGEPETIHSEQELDPKRYGVIVEHENRRGLLLPDLEGVDSAEEQIEIARRKAGIGAKEALKLWRFEVVRHK